MSEASHIIDYHRHPIHWGSSQLQMRSLVIVRYNPIELVTYATM